MTGFDKELHGKTYLKRLVGIQIAIFKTSNLPVAVGIFRKNRTNWMCLCTCVRAYAYEYMCRH